MRNTQCFSLSQMAKSTGFSQAAHGWCSSVWFKNLPTSPVATQKCTEPADWGSITFEAGLWSSASVTRRGAHRKKVQVTPGKVTQQCQRELSPSCSPDAPLSTQCGTKLSCHHEQTQQCLLHQPF